MDRLLASRQSLTEALRTRGVVPVIGPDAVQVETQNPDGTRATVPFYELVTAELLQTYDVKLPAAPAGEGGPTWLVHRAVAQIVADRGDTSTERIRRSVSSIVKAVAQRCPVAPLLDRLARLRAFDLFVSLTPDDLLVDALKRVHGEDAVEVVAYAPNADSSQAADMAPPRPGAVRVFFPLGRSATGTRLAVHEEDALEYLFKFQEDGTRRAPNLLTQLRSSDLLMLGCDLPDWLGRAFLRLANESRLSSPDKKMEFFAADARDPGLNGFLSRFNPNSSVFPWSPLEFVAELEGFVGAQGGGTALPPPPPPPPTVPARAAGTPGSGPTVFLSYASENGDAARQLANALVGLGFGDVWFDKRKLVAGDDWSDQIDEAIERCDFFLPVLSRQADARREGVFWEEWRKAVARAMRVNDAFLLPVGIDELRPDRSGYQRIFSGFTNDFRRIHLMHAPAGRLSADDGEQLRERVQRFKAGGGG
jgi:hypothetical protein